MLTTVSPLLVINDALMAVFFFLVGMEIKRELVNGELSSIKKSSLPIFGAIGGMLVPALLFTLFNKGTDSMQGWAVPTATDIAFTLGVASLLGKRIPVGLKIFITALAIIDDLGAIIVIALFYGGELQRLYLLGCGSIVFILFLIPELFLFLLTRNEQEQSRFEDGTRIARTRNPVTQRKFKSKKSTLEHFNETENEAEVDDAFDNNSAENATSLNR